MEDRPNQLACDVVVLGAGLAGLCAAIELARRGLFVVIVDRPPLNGGESLGGFAHFSGAKFSLPPAGKGLIPVAGGVEAFESEIRSTLGLLELSPDIPAWTSTDAAIGDGLVVRRYLSHVLTPQEMRGCVERLKAMALGLGARLVSGDCRSIETSSDGVCLHIRTPTGRVQARCAAALIATGRASNYSFLPKSVRETQLRGLDIGVRIEFDDLDPLAPLRALGPDTKVLKGRYRTFCLNSPGHVLRYPAQTFTVPGGVVAERGHGAANVGLLMRMPERARPLDLVAEQVKAAKLRGETLDHFRSWDVAHEVLSAIVGNESAGGLVRFYEMLVRSGLIKTSGSSVRIHYPLVDWHWPTFGSTASARTTDPRFFVAGDSAGHARGLLQAAVSGRLAAAEIADVVF